MNITKINNTGRIWGRSTARTEDDANDEKNQEKPEYIMPKREDKREKGVANHQKYEEEAIKEAEEANGEERKERKEDDDD